jgi:hypothetical protein
MMPGMSVNSSQKTGSMSISSAITAMSCSTKRWKSMAFRRTGGGVPTLVD